MADTQAKHLREYETIFLVTPDLTDEAVDKLKERVRQIVNREGGKHLQFKVWGKKRTTYPVAKQPRAIYVHSHYLGNSGMVAEVERNLRNIDEVSRFLSVKISDEVDPETRPVIEDVRMAGDVDEPKPGVHEREGGFREGGFREGGYREGGFREGGFRAPEEIPDEELAE